MALYETEDSESSAALRHQLAQFEAIHASLQDAVYIVDTTGVIIYCNSALTALTGYEPAELLQRPSETLYPALSRCNPRKNPLPSAGCMTTG